MNRSVALTTLSDLMPRLKKEYSDTPTPHLGLHGLFYGEMYLLYLTKRNISEIRSAAEKFVNTFRCSYGLRTWLTNISLLHSVERHDG